MKLISIAFTVSLCVLLTLGAPEGRISNSKVAADHQFPFMAVIHTLWFDDICGATVLNKRWVLSSARCSKLGQYTALVSFGLNKLEDKHKLLTSVDRIVVHPEYDGQTFANDIALFHLKGQLEFTDEVQPVILSKEHVVPDTKLVITGWGSVSAVTSKPSNDLMYKEVETIATDECVEEFPSNVLSDDTQTCAYGTRGGGGGCKGDLGDPVLTASGEQVGILSYGGTCAGGKPDVHTRIEPYLVWIEEVIQSTN